MKSLRSCLVILAMVTFGFIAVSDAHAQATAPKWGWKLPGGSSCCEGDGTLYSTFQMAFAAGDAAALLRSTGSCFVAGLEVTHPVYRVLKAPLEGQDDCMDVQVIAICSNGAWAHSGWCPLDGPIDHDRDAGPKPCEESVGNPCVPSTGNKTEVAIDYEGQGRFPLRLVRTFNHIPATGSTLGRKWQHSYERGVARLADGNGPLPMAGVVRPNGARLLFTQNGGDWVAAPDVLEKLQSITDGQGAIVGWRVITADDEVELYDVEGRLQSITNRHGLAQTLQYFSSGPHVGMLQQVADAFGRSLVFTYNADHRVSTVTDPAGEQISYSYSFYGELQTVTYPGPVVRTYQYQNPDQFTSLLVGIVDENGAQFATFSYDGSGKVASSEHAGGAERVELTYNGGQTTVKKFVNATTFSTHTYEYQVINNLDRRVATSGEVCPQCGLKTGSYDSSSGYPQSRTNWNDVVTNYTFDSARGLETLRVQAVGTPQERTTTTEWHPAFRLISRQAEPLRITTYTYNGDGGAQCGLKADGVTLVPGVLCSVTIQATTDATGSQGFGATSSGTPRTTSYTYNHNGSVLTEDGPRTDASDVTTNTYYADNDADINKRGRLAGSTNAAGHLTQVTSYNVHGQPLTVIDPNGLTTTFTYDARQRLKTRTAGSEVTSHDYDNVGQLTKTTLPDGSFLSHTYDNAHRLTGVQDNAGNRIAYTLDMAGNRTLEQVFDPANVLVQTRSRVYSNLNRLFQELGAQNQTTEYTYDDQGNVTSVKDPLNHITGKQYDALNRLKQVTDPASGVAQYGYNGLDALIQVTDPRNLVTGYSVDGLGNLTLQASPDTGNTVSTYDAAGNLLTRTDAKGQVTTYSYDALNRVTLATFHDGSKHAYVYDQGSNGIGRLTSITETDPANQQTSLISYAYNQHGRVTSETRTVSGVPYVLGYGYDSAGRLSGLTYPSGRTLTYTHDSVGRVDGISTTFNSQTQQVVSNVAYHPFGGVRGYTLGNGRVYSRSYDQDGRITTYTLGTQSFSIGYDAASRIEFINEFGNPANTNLYGYDSLDRLTSAVIPGTPYGYSYDGVGNRLTKTAGAGTETLTYNPTNNRIATLTPASGPVKNFVFDANGSTTNDGANTFVYDVRGRMVQATSVIGATSYQVNALGQRIRKANSQGDTVFHYDSGGRLIAETDPGGPLKREFIYLGNIPVAVYQ